MSARKTQNLDFAAVIENSPHLMSVVDSEGRYVLVSPPVVQAIGRSKEEIIGAAFEDVLPEQVCREFRSAIHQLQQTRKTIHKIDVVPIDDEEKVYETCLYPVQETCNCVTLIGIQSIEITDRKKAEEQLIHLTFHDTVTGLYNRTFFEEEIHRLSSDRQIPISLIMIDVNGLKVVNDALGHQKGDELLQEVATILLQSCRAEDIIARWGGDEFVVLLPQTTGTAAQEICERIRKACSASNQGIIQPSVALGYATKTQSEQTIQQVLKQAEDAMYRNKMLSAKSSRSDLVASLQQTLQEKSHETKEHAHRLQNVSVALGEALGMSGSDLDKLSLSALLHDIGKVAIPGNILDKPESLDAAEWELMKQHPEMGYRIAAASPELATFAEYILTHHERWDGSGYPKGLKGGEIPFLSRILAVVDAYDAMTHDRPYRKGMPSSEVLEEIKVCMGFQFDPKIVKVFVDMMSSQTALDMDAGAVSDPL